jgi:tRNA threonylcarbamoyladenosine biosynthesis protein TsaE
MRNESASSAQEMELLGIEFGKALAPVSVIAFRGDLGAGKTTFIKGLVQGSAGFPSCEVNSPTFTYLNIYQGSKNVYHFDLYRLKNSEDFVAMGFEEYFTLGICCIEWSERIQEILPKNTLHVEIQHCGQTLRNICFA